MWLLVLFTYFLMGILLFIIMNYLSNKFKLNITNYIVFSLIYILIMASLYKINSSIYLVLFFEFLTDLIYTSYFKEENFFKYKNKILMYIILIVLGFVINQTFLRYTNMSLNLSEIRILLWFLIIIFIYNFFQNFDLSISSLKNNNNKNSLNDREYIVMTFAKMKNRYHEILKEHKEVSNIVYAGMIYLNHERPYYLRKIDFFKYKIDNKKRRYGIMQIESLKALDDIESIKKSIIEIEKIWIKFKKKKMKKDVLYDEVIKEYYKKDDTEKIIEIYKTVVDFNNN